MKDFPSKLTPQNITNFLKYKQNRDVCRLKQKIYEFMLTSDFVNNKNRGFELQEFGRMPDVLNSVIESLKTLGWETEIALHGTFLFIYPPGEKPKMLKNLFEDF
jgi:hypothetical protein